MLTIPYGSDLTPFRVYQIFMSMKFYFNKDTYDAIKYNFKSKSFNETNFAKWHENRLTFAIPRYFKTERDFILALGIACSIGKGNSLRCVLPKTTEIENYMHWLTQDTAANIRDSLTKFEMSGNEFFDEIYHDTGELSIIDLAFFKIYRRDVYNKIIAADITGYRSTILEAKVNKLVKILMALNTFEEHQRLLTSLNR